MSPGGLHEITKYRERQRRKLFIWFILNKFIMEYNSLLGYKSNGMTTLRRTAGNTLNGPPRDSSLLLKQLYEFGLQLLGVHSRTQLHEFLHRELQPVIGFSGLTIGLPDDRKHNWREFVSITGTIQKNAAPVSLSGVRTYPISDGFFDHTLFSRSPKVWNIPEVLDWQELPAFIEERAAFMYRSAIGIALNWEEEISGCLFFFFEEDRKFASEDLECLAMMGRQISGCIANIFKQERAISRHREDAVLLGLVADIAAIRSKGELALLFDKMRSMLACSHVVIGVLSEDKTSYRAFLLDPRSPCLSSPHYRRITEDTYPVPDGIVDKVIGSGEPAIYDLQALRDTGHVPGYVEMNYEFGIRHIIVSPLTNGIRKEGIVLVLFRDDRELSPGLLSMVQAISSQLSIAVSRVRAEETLQTTLTELSNVRQMLAAESNYFPSETPDLRTGKTLTGSGKAMRKLVDLISTVAATDTSVLIMGETGTGKELVAMALHNASRRQSRAIIKVNCSSIPASLIESELFGHERGSFTGATERRIGKFELAHNGTLFLDEIGEIPLDLQSKLLRALQEREVERVGGRTVIKTDVRIIAATNRDLEKEVARGHFRSDLYYRLNVFPLFIPPLRQRKEDIPELVACFLEKYAKRDNRPRMNISRAAIRKLMEYDWPGNVRELEHVIERNMVLAKGKTITQLNFGVPDWVDKARFFTSPIKTIAEVEREHILSVLKLCNGKISGAGGAAERLRIPATTLASKIIRLGIKKDCNLK